MGRDTGQSSLVAKDQYLFAMGPTNDAGGNGGADRAAGEAPSSKDNTTSRDATLSPGACRNRISMFKN